MLCGQNVRKAFFITNLNYKKIKSILRCSFKMLIEKPDKEGILMRNS